jgi:mannose-6-phosphate isomerase-like protein (cupin superfamily)
VRAPIRRTNQEREDVMKARIAWFFAGVVFTAGIGGVLAAKKELVLMPAGELKWEDMPPPPGMKEPPAGAPKMEPPKVAKISGDMMKGAYAAFVSVPAGQPHPLHTHGSDTKAIVISGTFTVTPDGGAEKKIGPGGYFFIPANAKHSSACAPGAPCVMYQEGPGKFDVKFVEEKSAAAEKKK